MCPFEAATTEISGDTYISISKLIPLVKSLVHFTASDSSRRELTAELMVKLRRRFGAMDSNHFLAECTLLDPRLKKLAFRDLAAAQQGVEWLIQEMSAFSTSHGSSEIDTRVLASSSTNSCNLWAMFDAKIAEVAEVQSRRP